MAVNKGKRPRPRPATATAISDTVSEPENLLESDANILSTLKSFSDATKASTSKTLTLSDLPLSSFCRDISQHSISSVQSEIETVVFSLHKSISSYHIGGNVVGRLSFSDNGYRMDCTKFERPIPPKIDRVGDMSSDALFILLVGKDPPYMTLAEDRFFDRFPCIIVRGNRERHPDVATMLFVRKLKLEFKLPVLALVDSDPYGLKILSFYGRGLKNMSYDTTDIKWLGLRRSDLDKHKISESCRMPMTKKDIKIAKDMLEDDFVKKNPLWVEELNLMVKTKQKVEIEALCSWGIQYLSKVFLPLKLQQKDWL